MRCSFGSVTVSERVYPGRIGKSPKNRQLVQEGSQCLGPQTDQRGRSHRGTNGEATVGRIEKGMGASQGEGLNRKAGLGNTPRLPLLGNAWGESIASISGASRCSVLPALNLRQVLA